MMNYLTESVVVLGLFLAVYKLMIKNLKRFQLNRFYLLGALVLSLTSPLISFEGRVVYDQPAAITNSSVPNVSYMAEENLGTGKEVIQEKSISGWQWLAGIYLLVTLAFLFRFGFHLIQLRLLSRSKGIRLYGMQTVSVQSQQPFSFFNYLFIHDSDLDRKDELLDVILHEKAHAEQRHSVDILLLESVLCFTWYNPFMWLLRKEIKENHEYLADEAVLSHGHVLDAYARRLLQFTHPAAMTNLTSGFGYALVKNRLKMMYRHTVNKGQAALRLTLAATGLLSVLAFSTLDTIHREKNILVVVDAGHGGKDNGAIDNDIIEKSVCLKISLELQRLSENTPVEIKLLRSDDSFLTISERIDLVNQIHPDLFLSIHLGKSDDPKQTGVEVHVADEEPFRKTSLAFGNLMSEKLSEIASSPVTLKEAPFRILKGAQCPTVLVAGGYLSNPTEAEQLRNEQYQTDLAKQLLEAMSAYRKTE